MKNFEDSTTRAVTYHTIGLIIYFAIMLTLITPALFSNIEQKNYFSYIAFLGYYIFNMIVVFVYSKL